VQVDADTSAVGWFTRKEGVDYAVGIIIRNGVAEVASGAELVSTYETGGQQLVVAARLTLRSPRGDIHAQLERMNFLPLRYQKDGRMTRLIECAARLTNGRTNMPAWMEYIDEMQDGQPSGNLYR
jgi:hypothetical protein